MAVRFAHRSTHDPHSSSDTLAGRKRLILPALISLAFLVIISFLALPHTFGTYATETDFYHYYAPDAERVARGEFPENPFQGPGYPVVLALGKLLTGDLFTAGKWLSIIGAAVVGFLAFLLFERAFGYWVGVGAQLIIFVSDQFPEFAMNATTDAFFLMLCLATFVVFTSHSFALLPRVALTAALTSLAYLTRYNAVFLVPVFLFGITLLDYFDSSWRERLRLSAVFVGVFLLVSAPWFYANHRHRGSPLYNANYLNMATEFYPELANDNVFQEGTRKLSERFSSFGEVLAYDPARVLRHYPVNFYESFVQSVTGDLVSPWVGWFALAGLVLALFDRRRTKTATLLLVSCAAYLLLLALTHWEARYYFYIMAVYAGLAVYAAFRLLELMRARGILRHPAAISVPIILVAVMWGHSLTMSKKETTKFLRSHPREVLKACDYFRAANITQARVVARKPHVAYICRQEWLFFPSVKSLDELRAWSKENRADYITISSVEISRRRELAALKDPRNAPAWLEPVWVNAGAPFVLYRFVKD